MRKIRHIVPKAIYHVCARANRQEMILEDIQFKYMLLDVIVRAKKKYRFIFRNFCIMGNHIHLEIEPQGNIAISKIMQWILSVFAVQYNKLFNYRGHVWYDRFKSKVIESLQQLINTTLYIASNPVRAGLVNHPLEFVCNGLTFHEFGAPHHSYTKLLDSLSPELCQVVRCALDKYDSEKHKGLDSVVTFRCKSSN